ncbi:MAG: type II toxin-antitoxin system HicA family toxin [Chloroflexi bacterium]|nr:type II toxin-antitoxin system HicA family toxin [Chloroflexota bacterium]
MPPRARQVMRLLEQDGWRWTRSTGSHYIYVHPSKPGHVAVPGPPNREIRPGLYHAILRQAGLKGGRR